MSESAVPSVPLSEVSTNIKDGTHGSHARVENGIPFLSAKNITDDGRLSWGNDDEMISEADYRAITSTFSPQRDDLLVTIVGSLGRTALCDGSRVAFQRSVAFVRPNERIVPEYLLQVSKTPSFSRQLVRRSNATAQAGLYLGELGKVEIPLPSTANQRRIAEILSTVDEAIEQTEALIAKTQQIKTGLMHDIFTRGVTPDGRLRPPRDQAPELYKQSPLGWIPREWEAVRLSEIADLQVGFAFSSADFQPEGINLLRGENVGYGKPIWNDRQCLPPEIARHFSEYLLRADDVIIGMDRTFTKTGVKVSVVSSEDCPALLVQRVGRFVPTGCDSAYLRWLVQYSSYHTALFAQQKGMDIPHLSSTEILAPQVPFPTPTEQRQIATRVASIVATLEAASAQTQKLGQLKSGLMNRILNRALSTNGSV